MQAKRKKEEGKNTYFFLLPSSFFSISLRATIRSMNKRLIVGNWKMNPLTLSDAKKIARMARRAAASLLHTEVVICPPLVFIPACISKIEPDTVSVGAQNISAYEDSPHTGEISGTILHNLGARYVIVGHSEVRAVGESDETVSKKIQMALSAGLRPVVCVGELVRDEGGAYMDTLRTQIRDSFANVPKSQARNIVLAYEPVWAIGAKEAMLPEQIYEMSLFVKKAFADVFGHDPAMKVPVLYGGSVTYRNAADIISVGKVDGLLPGRESVNMSGFPDLLHAVDSVPI